MRLLTLTNAYPPHDYGGYELTCRDVMEIFARAGHEITVLTSTARVQGVEETREPAVRRTLIPYWDWEQAHATIPRSPISRLNVERHNVTELSRTIDEVRPDVVSVWHMAALSLSLLTVIEQRAIPMVITVANEWMIAAPLMDGWARLWRHWPMDRPRSFGGVPTALPGLTDASVNFVSAFTRDKTTQAGRWRFPDAPVVCAGIDERDFPVVTRAEQAWEWRLLYVGRVDATKGLETLLTAFARLPATATLTILGRGNHGYQSELRSRAAELGVDDRVTFSSTPRTELAQHYQRADVVVFPSEWEEPFGLVPLEAMACGVPVVSTVRGGSGEFLRPDQNCVTFDSGDPASLADAVMHMAGDPELRRRIVEQGAATAGTFTISHYAAALLPLHEEAAGIPTSA